jgi:O-antigen/teichoic acid export membrane protein
MQNLGTSIRRGTLWLFSGNLSKKLLQFFFGVILARLLVPSDFGALVTIQVFTGAAGFIAGGGMGQALVQAKEVSDKHFHVVFTTQLLICSLIYTAFFIIAPYFAAWFDNPLYSSLLRVSALSFFIRPFYNIPRAKLTRKMQFKGMTILGIVNGILTGVCSTILALNDFGAWSLVIGGLFGTVAITPVLMGLAGFFPKFQLDKQILRTMGSYGVKFSINDIIFYLRSQTSNFLISKFLGPSAVGLFNKGDSLSELPVSTISGSAYQTVFRALSSKQDNLDQSRYLYLRTITLVSTYTFPFYVALLWLSEPFIVTVYGEKWILSAIPLQILSIAGLFRCVANPSGAVMAAQNLLGTEIKVQLVSWALIISGCSAGIFYGDGDLGLIAIGLLPGFIFLMLTQNYFALRALNSSFKELFNALKPAIQLNVVLAIALAIGNLITQTLYPEASYALTLISLSLIGGITYSIYFLFFPPSPLKSESDRWRSLLRLRSV